MPIRVAVIEDNDGLRDSLGVLLTKESGLDCVGTYASAEEAIVKFPLAEPDVALIDIHLPGMTGIECVARLKTQHPDLQVLMLTLYEREDLIFDAIRAGADGYLLKRMPPEELIEAIRLVN